MNDSSISTSLVFPDFRNLICSVTGMNMNVMNLETNSLNGKKGLSLHYLNRRAVFPMVNNGSRLYLLRGNYIPDLFFGREGGVCLGNVYVA